MALDDAATDAAIADLYTSAAEETQWRCVWFPPQAAVAAVMGSEAKCRKKYVEAKDNGFFPVLERCTITRSPWEMVETTEGE